MTDLHAQIRAEVERRLGIARAASMGPWMAATHTGRKDGVSLIGRVEDRGTGKAVAVFAGADVHQRANDAEHAALHDPADAIRRYEYALKVLDMHQWRAPGVKCGCDDAMCSCGEHVPWPCDELIWLATSLGVEVSS